MNKGSRKEEAMGAWEDGRIDAGGKGKEEARGTAKGRIGGDVAGSRRDERLQGSRSQQNVQIRREE